MTSSVKAASKQQKTSTRSKNDLTQKPTQAVVVCFVHALHRCPYLSNKKLCLSRPHFFLKLQCQLQEYKTCFLCSARTHCYYKSSLHCERRSLPKSCVAPPTPGAASHQRMRPLLPLCSSGFRLALPDRDGRSCTWLRLSS